MRGVFRSSLLFLLLPLAGCGESRIDKLVKTNIRLMNAEAEELETLVQAPPREELDACLQRINKIKNEMKENNEAMRKHTLEEINTSMVKFKDEMASATERLNKAGAGLVPAKVPKPTTGEKPLVKK